MLDEALICNQKAVVFFKQAGIEKAPTDKGALLLMFLKNYEEKVESLKTKIENLKTNPVVNDEDLFIVINEHQA